jgi:hypothetical protein
MLNGVWHEPDMLPKPGFAFRPIGTALGLWVLLGVSGAAGAASPTSACRVEGMPNELQCGLVKRPLDPAKPAGTQIEVHFVLVPAMARNKQPDPVLLLAGGPGQRRIAQLVEGHRL